MKWEIRGFQNGKAIRAAIEAVDEHDARRMATDRGVTVQSVLPMTAVPPVPSRPEPVAAVEPVSRLAYQAPAPMQASVPASKITSGLGVASLVLGILGTVLFCIPVLTQILALVGLVLGVVGLIVSVTGKRHRIGMPIAGILVSLLPFLIWAVVAAGLASIGGKYHVTLLD